MLNSIRIKIQEIENELRLKNQPITSIIIYNELFNRGSQEKTLIGIYKEHNEKLKKLIGKDFAFNTFRRHETSLAHVQKFIKNKYHKNEILIHEITPSFIL